MTSEPPSRASVERLAPVPDFRWVGFEPAPRGFRRVMGSLATGGATASVALLGHASVQGAMIVGFAASLFAGLGMRLRDGPVRSWRAKGVRLAFTPWGVVVEPEHDSHDEGHRVLRWAAIDRVHVDTVYGRDLHTPSTLYSNVFVDTARERFAARARGAVLLDAVLVHMDGYAREQAHRVALDLEGERAGDGPLEPDFEPLLSSALESLASAPMSQRLGLPSADYRRSNAKVASPETLELLRAVLTDRTAREIDPRAFAAVLAAELSAIQLSGELMALTSSPHPLLAAVARAAALRLGAHVTKVGALDEVTPFLHPADADAIARWAGVPSAAGESVRNTAS